MARPGLRRRFTVASMAFPCVSALGFGALGLAGCSSDTGTDPVGAEVYVTGTTPASPDSAALPTTADHPATVLRVGDVLFRATQPVDIIVRPGTDVAYLVGRLGTIQPLSDLNGPAPMVGDAVLDLSAELVPNFEEGLLGATFDPDGSHLYLNLVSQLVTHILEFVVAEDGSIEASTRREVYTVAQPAEAHNGGSLLYGPDGYLYVFLGDGGEFEGGRRRAQQLDTPLGKILRIDPTPSGDAAFTVPSDNPFVDTPGALGEIWTIGVRNPWRASFDPANGDLWFGDVGEYFYEEVDVARAADGAGRGKSFGWPALEGTAPNDKGLSPDGHVAPYFDYLHSDVGCSVSGGHVYRGSNIPGLVGWYVFGDYCSGRMWALESEARGSEPELIEFGNVPNVVAIAADANGELYAVSVQGDVHRIEGV